MRALLSDMGPAAAKTNDADSRRLQNGVALGTEKALSRQTAHATLQRSMGIPMTLKVVMISVSDAPRRQTRPNAAVSLKTIAPWIASGATDTKFGMNLAFSRVSTPLKPGMPRPPCECTWNIASAIVHRPLACAADGVRAHHRSDARIGKIFLIAHRPVLAGKNQKLVMRGSEAGRNETDSLMGKRVRTPQVSADGVQQGARDLEPRLHATALKCADTICLQGIVAGT